MVPQIPVSATCLSLEYRSRACDRVLRTKELDAVSWFEMHSAVECGAFDTPIYVWVTSLSTMPQPRARQDHNTVTLILLRSIAKRCVSKDRGHASSQHEDEPMLMAANGSRGAAPRMREGGSASSLPPPDLGLPTSRRTEAPPVSPGSADQGRDGWLSELLNRTDAGATNREAPRGRPAQQGSGGNPLESLSLDIGRLMDRNLAAEMWDRYQRGESKAFSKRLYTPAGQKAFDEVARKYRSDRNFKQTVDHYIIEFERLLDEVARDERGPAMLRSHLTSETGLVYTLLAHAAGRLG
jgi:hypothetical protein